MNNYINNNKLQVYICNTNTVIEYICYPICYQ